MGVGCWLLVVSCQNAWARSAHGWTSFTKSRNACGKEVLDSVGMRVLAQGRHESSRIHEEFIHARAIMPKAQKYTVEGGRMSPSAHRAL